MTNVSLSLFLVSLFSLSDIAVATPLNNGITPGTQCKSSVYLTKTRRIIANTQGLYLQHERLYEKDGAYDAESIMEIVPYGKTEAYIRMRTSWGNYHSCSLYGIFALNADVFTYRRDDKHRGSCEMRIQFRNGVFETSAIDLMTGEEMQVCLGSCGARGTFSGDLRFTKHQQRPLRYMRRLLNSNEYKVAVAHRHGKIPDSDTLYLSDLAKIDKHRGKTKPAFASPSCPSGGPPL